MASQDTTTLVIEDDDGTTNELEAPTELLDLLRQGGESNAKMIGDIAMIGLAQRIHGAVHHAQGEPDQEVKDAENVTMELFEERFDETFGEMTGHEH